MDQKTTRTGQPGDPQSNVFSRVPEPLPPHGAQLDLTTQPLQSATSRPVAEPQQPAPSDPTPEELLTAANTPHYTPAPVPSSWNAPAPTEPTPAPVKRPKAAKVFKWSAGLGVLCFFLFGLCIETFDPDAESFIAGVFAIGFFFGGLTAAISGVMALFNLFRGK
ncbi:hypothetical protein [Corynebacterium fournieri]|uniref:hypothetical protein n=1 Tax=Corynebacterium fournieri TaxID=1852390 RepID=UPI0011783EEC|nr:hypothetical protein [Corynebacterium fournieri]WJY96708.1 hypothetical protein CFOUR_01330 [Corynebacterium fournieri]